MLPLSLAFSASAATAEEGAGAKPVALSKAALPARVRRADRRERGVVIIGRVRVIYCFLCYVASTKAEEPARVKPGFTPRNSKCASQPTGAGTARSREAEGEARGRGMVELRRDTTRKHPRAPKRTRIENFAVSHQRPLSFVTWICRGLLATRY